MSGTNLTNEQKNFQNTVDILRRQREAQADLVVQLNVQIVAQNEYITALTGQNTALQEVIVDLQAKLALANGQSVAQVSTIALTPAAPTLAGVVTVMETIDTDSAIS